MEINGVVVVEEPKRSDLELLETSVGIVAVIQCSISWASVGVLFSWF